MILKSLLHDEVKVDFTIDDVRLKPKLTSNKTLRFTKQSFFNTKIAFAQSHTQALCYIESFIQLIPGTYKSEKHINITGINKNQLRCYCINGSIVNGVREPILYSFALDKPPGHKIFEEPRMKVFKKIKKSVLSHITFYLEDDDRKPVDFNGETVSFIHQLLQKVNK